MPHGAAATGGPSIPGQDAFGATAETVQILDAEPPTDWSKVVPDRLHQHVRDMN